MKTLNIFTSLDIIKLGFHIKSIFLDNLLPCPFVWGGENNPKSTIISQLLQVPMATDLASGEKDQLVWLESLVLLWKSILLVPSSIPWWKANQEYPKLLVSQVIVISSWKGLNLSHYPNVTVTDQFLKVHTFHVTFFREKPHLCMLFILFFGD